MTFLSAGLLAGLLLASVPIIIHILNRRRFQVIDWPPMKYLKLTLKKNRRRVRIEQMILLAIRTLAVILLILAVARPVISQGALDKLMPGRARTSRVIVIDDSLSMGYVTAGHSAFQMAQNAAQDLLKTMGAQDNVTIIVTSAPDRPLIKDASLQDAPKFVDLIGGLHLTDTPNNWAATLESAHASLSSASFSNKELIVITDLRRSGWSDEAYRPANELAADRIPMHVIDVGDRRSENTALLRFELQDPIPLSDQPIHFAAAVRNHTSATITNAQATLSVDGDSRPVLLPDLPAGSVTDVPLTLTLDTSGVHTLALSLAKDALPEDGTRYLTLTVRPTVSVLLVDGAPAAQAFESETDFLALAYSVGVHPWNVERSTEVNVRQLAAHIPDVLVLADVPSLTNEQAEAIQSLVEKGMGLMIFTGDQIDFGAYNDHVYRGGKGLLPIKLDRSSETPTAGIEIEKDPQSPLASMAKLLPAALARVRTRQYTAVQGGAPGAALDEGVSILARWNNGENPPAVLQKTIGKGHVLLFTTTAGKKWTDWPLDPTYVLAVRSAALGIARSQSDTGSFVAGEMIRLEIDARQSVLDPKITPPAGEAPDIVSMESSPTGTALHYAKTQNAGIYTLNWRNEKSVNVSTQVAVNPPPAESDLEPLAEGQLATFLGNLRPTIDRYDTRGVGFGQPVRELWRPLATILLLLMAAEVAFAAWVGRDR